MPTCRRAGRHVRRPLPPTGRHACACRQACLRLPGIHKLLHQLWRGCPGCLYDFRLQGAACTCTLGGRPTIHNALPCSRPPWWSSQAKAFLHPRKFTWAGGWRAALWSAPLGTAQHGDARRAAASWSVAAACVGRRQEGEAPRLWGSPALPWSEAGVMRELKGCRRSKAPVDPRASPRRVAVGAWLAAAGRARVPGLAACSLALLLPLS